MSGKILFEDMVPAGQDSGKFYMLVSKVPYNAKWYELKNWLTAFGKVDYVDLNWTDQSSTDDGETLATHSGWVLIRGKEMFERVLGGIRMHKFRGRKIEADDRNETKPIWIRRTSQRGCQHGAVIYGERNLRRKMRDDHTDSHHAGEESKSECMVIVVPISNSHREASIEKWIRMRISHQDCELTRFWICPPAQGDGAKTAFLEFSNVDAAAKARKQLLPKSPNEKTVESISKANVLSIQSLIKQFQWIVYHSRQQQGMNGSQSVLDDKRDPLSKGSEIVTPFVAINGFPNSIDSDYIRRYIVGKFFPTKSRIKTVRVFPVYQESRRFSKVHLKFEHTRAGKQAAQHAISLFEGVVYDGQILKASLFIKTRVKKPAIVIACGSSRAHSR